MNPDPPCHRIAVQQDSPSGDVITFGVVNAFFVLSFAVSRRPRLPCPRSPRPAACDARCGRHPGGHGESAVRHRRHAKRLDTAREHIQPAWAPPIMKSPAPRSRRCPAARTSSSTRSCSRRPASCRDGFGQFHVRDDHNGLQYRINGTILPEGWRCSARPCRRAWSTRSTS